MSTLKRLGLGSYSGDQSLYDWLLSNFKSKHFGAEVVTYGLLTDLKGFLHLRRSRHDEETPPNRLSRKQLCHILIHLVIDISSENVTKSMEKGVWRRLTAKDKENHDPNELWAAGIEFIKKHSSGISGDTAPGEGDGVGHGGDGGTDDHAGPAEGDPPGDGGGLEETGKKTRKQTLDYFLLICPPWLED